MNVIIAARNLFAQKSGRDVSAGEARSIGEASRHAKRASGGSFSFSRVIFIVTMIFLLMPLVVLFISSFNESPAMRWTRFSLRWYERLLTERGLWQSFVNSIIVAVSAALTATIFGTLGAIGVIWYKFRLRNYIQTISLLPTIMPEIIVGVSLAIFFSSVGIPLGLFTVYLAHTTFCLPFVFLMVKARLDEFDFSIIEAAQDLGATERQTLMKVTIPVCLPGIIAGFLTAVTLSLQDFVITFFVAGPGATTLPIFIFSAITRRGAIAPMISALSVVMIIGTVILAYLFRNFLRYFVSK